MNANNGYIGWSMSVRAAEAYEMGEMPKSKWTKARMLAEIAAYVNDNDVDMSDEAGEYLRSLTKTELFRRFFTTTSWHHTSKFFNETDFYALDEYAIDEYAANPTRVVYHVRYSLGGHSVTTARSFATEAQAERYLERGGFTRRTYSFERGAIRASVTSIGAEI